MPLAEASRNQAFDAEPGQFFARVAKQPLGGRIGHADATTHVRDQHSIGRRLKQPYEALLLEDRVLYTRRFIAQSLI
jgi:hypothetical protein